MHYFKRNILAKTEEINEVGYNVWRVIRTDTILEDIDYLNVMERIVDEDFDEDLFPYRRNFNIKEVLSCKDSLLNKRNYLIKSEKMDAFGMKLEWYITEDWKD